MVYWLGLAAAGFLYSAHSHASAERANFEVKAECHVQGKASGSFTFTQRKYIYNTEITGTGQDSTG